MGRLSNARSALLLGVSASALLFSTSAQAGQFTAVGLSGPEKGFTEDDSSFFPPAVGGQRFGANAGDIPNIVFDPSNANRAFAGAANGGIWRTTDG